VNGGILALLGFFIGGFIAWTVFVSYVQPMLVTSFYFVCAIPFGIGAILCGTGSLVLMVMFAFTGGIIGAITGHLFGSSSSDSQNNFVVLSDA